MTTRIALMGAGGKMGSRITDNIKDLDQYAVAYVEVGEEGLQNLAARGLTATPQAEALADADVIVLAVPDRLIGPITREIVPQVRSGAMVIGLDPAAAYAGVMPERDDIIYFISHPCHPPLFNDETTPEARTDWFGGVHAAQPIVCALFQGPEGECAKDKAFEEGEAIAKAMFAPVTESYRVTVEQMAILEPALVETLASTCITIIHEAMEKAVAMGVPADAARAFLLGHIRIQLAVIFDFAGFPFSDGAILAIEQARDKIFRDDWMENVFDLEAIKRSVAAITGKEKA
jgi:hypothetical protein